MNEEESEEDEQKSPKELTKDQLKAMMMSEFKAETYCSKQITEGPKMEAQMRHRNSSKDQSGALAGPYLENIHIRAPQNVTFEVSRRPISGASSNIVMGSHGFYENCLGKYSETHRDTPFLGTKLAEGHVSQENGFNYSLMSQTNSISNELDQQADRFSTLFGQKVDRNKLLGQNKPAEDDPMVSIFHKKVDQEMTETDETIKKEKLKDRLDKLRSLVSKNSVDLGYEV